MEQIKVDIRNLSLRFKERFMISNPGKVQVVVLINKEIYINSVKQIFEDLRKCKVLNDDPAVTKVKIVQNFLKMLLKQEERTPEEEK